MSYGEILGIFDEKVLKRIKNFSFDVKFFLFRSS